MLCTQRIGARIGSADPFWVQTREAVTQCVQQLGLDLVTVDRDQLEVGGREFQLESFEGVRALDLDALICAYLPENIAQQLLDAGLPIVHLTETTMRHPLLVSISGYYHTARLVGRFLKERLGGRGRLLVAGGLTTYGEDGRSRIAGIRDELQDTPEIVIRHIPTSWRYEDAYPQIEAALQVGEGPLDAIFGLSDSVALAARDAVRALGMLGDNTLVVGINGDPLILAAIARGQATATVDTTTETLAARAVALACAAARGEPLPDHFSYDARLVTAANVADVAVQKLIAIADLPSRLVGVNREQEQQRMAQLEIGQEINRRVGSILDRQQLSTEIAGLIRESYGYDIVQILIWQEREQCFLLEGDEPARFPLADAGVLGAALQHGAPIFIPNVRTTQRFPPDGRFPETCSRVSVPIRVGGAVTGVLDLHSRRDMPHSRPVLDGLQSLADQLGIALRNAELYSDALEALALSEKADQLKTRLLANVSHELRAPLNIILGYSQTMLAAPDSYGVELPPALLGDVRHIYHSGEHLIRLINDLLDLSRAEIDALELFPEPLLPSVFLEDALRGLMNSVAPQPGVVCRPQIDQELPLISADPVRLRQVLYNLLSNALKFTHSGEIVVGAEAAPPYLHVWISDTGPGIPPEQHERIFEPFVTGGAPHQRSEGVGLGLSIAHRLVALHHGMISLESSPGAGSTFHVYLPLPSLECDSASAPAHPQPVLLLISACETLPAAIGNLSRLQGLGVQRLRPGDDLEILLSGLRPAALAWEATRAGEAEWGLLQQLRAYPQVSRLPLVIFGQGVAADQQSGITSVLGKPLQGKTLIEAIEAVRWPAMRGSVLIVDDDQQTRTLYRDLVGQALPGRPVRLADGGRAALEMLEYEVPSLVILDLTMPDVDGFTVLEGLRARPATRQVPVIIMSGKQLTTDDIRRLDYGLVMFQSKDVLSREEAVTLLSGAPSADWLPRPTSLAVKRAVAYIQLHHHRELSRQEIAEAVGVSKNYLTQIFHHELKLSPWEYLNRYRIGRAKELLRDTDWSITAVAECVGFEDAGYFGRVFRRQVGCSPQAYRERECQPLSPSPHAR